MESKQDERDLIVTLVKQNLKAYDEGVDLACDFIIEAITERNKDYVDFLRYNKPHP